MTERSVESEATDDGHAVDAGELTIDDHEGRPHQRGLLEALLARLRGDRAVAGRLERLANGLAKGHAVVDHEDRRSVRGHTRAALGGELARSRDDVREHVRFACVLVGPRREPADAVTNVRLRREHHHRCSPDRLLRSADLAEEIDPVAVCEPHVEDRDIEASLRERGPSLRERAAADDVEAGAVEPLDEVHPDREAVVDDERAPPLHRLPPAIKRWSAGAIASMGKTESAAPTSTAARGIP